MVEVLQEKSMRWTVSDIRRMIDSGAFAHPESFELLEGLIVEKMVRNEPHKVGLTLAREALRAVFAGNAKVVAEFL